MTKQFVFQILIEEGADEWWEDITKGGKSGVDGVTDLLRETFRDANIDCHLKLVKFEDS